MATSGVQQRESGAAAGNNPVGQVIKQFYGVGQDTTIRWGLLKQKVEAPVQNGKQLSFEEYRKATESEREQLRKQFADRLEVISYPERDRRRKVGIALGVLTFFAASYMVASGSPLSQRLLLSPAVFFSFGFIDSSIQGLCTESLAGAWDVDDRGLEYMPSKELARRIQKKVAGLYLRDLGLAVLVMSILCNL
jgi:hypothetical protein